MSAGLGIRPAAVPAFRALQQALARVDPTPCASDPDSWTDPPDAEVIEWAEHQCGRCPVINLCNTFATTNRERTGAVWAGRSRPITGGRPAAPRKDENR